MQGFRSNCPGKQSLGCNYSEDNCPGLFIGGSSPVIVVGAVAFEITKYRVLNHVGMQCSWVIH